MSEELKPCPFCDNRDVEHYGEYVHCPKCLADGPYFAGTEDDEDFATQAWNTRP